MKMKHALTPLALLATCGLAAAQSSVTLFGIADATVQVGSGSTANRTQLGSGGNSSSRIGVRGTEDLGGGLSAGFWLEAGLTLDSGTFGTTNTSNQTAGTSGGGGLVFGRRSTVSLAGTWGELRLGRDYSVQYYNRFEFDPFGNNGVGSSQTNVGSLGGPVSSRASNALMYFLPPGLGGWYGELQHYRGENPGNAGAIAADGTGSGARLGYRAGALNLSAAHARTRYARTATTGDITSSNLGARYDAGPFTAMGGIYRDRVETLTGTVGSGVQLGGIYRVGTGEVKVQWSQYQATQAAGGGSEPETKKLSLGYVHHLSKRTALYATYARVRNSGGATTALNGAATAANQASSGLDLGVRHSF
jgi:predicted porin